jgi:hypothetical protein
MALTFGIAVQVDQDGNVTDDGVERRLALTGEAFKLGTAWHGGQPAVFLRTELSIDEVMSRLLRTVSVESGDLIVAVEVGTGEVRWFGSRFDEEGFDALFAHAVEVEAQR